MRDKDYKTSEERIKELREMLRRGILDERAGLHLPPDPFDAELQEIADAVDAVFTGYDPL